MNSPYRYSFRYFPVNAAQKKWGLYATYVGHSRSKPGAEFPSREHPDEYYFSWDVGRVLHEWQMSLVESGCGMVEFSRRRFRVARGSLIVIPPECWHRYRPDPDTGWTTLCIGFNGDLATRLVGGAGFDSGGEVRDLSADSRFHQLFLDTVTYILESGHNNVYTAAAQIPMLVAALADAHSGDGSRTSSAELVRRAQTYITEHSNATIDFESLAESLGLKYRSFRYLFTKETGSSPLQYQLGIRLAWAKNLLRSSTMPIAEIAETLGFNSTWYFSHFFKKHTSTSAAEYRAAHAQMRGQGRGWRMDATDARGET